jgi:hypothetical protein
MAALRISHYNPPALPELHRRRQAFVGRMAGKDTGFFSLGGLAT